MKKLTTSDKQTFALAKKFAKTLKGGEVLALSGNLGAGKTVFTKGLATGLGIKKIVNSPTFLLMNIYQAKGNIKQLIHIDTYRLNKASDLVDIGASDYFGDPSNVVVIEWADKVKKFLPKKRIEINIEIKKENQRLIEIKNPQ